jgi:hypothetical protein
MLRGTVVRINSRCKIAHLVGSTGIAFSMNKAGNIRVLSLYDGWLTDLCYEPDELDAVEAPTELTPAGFQLKNMKPPKRS